MCRAWASEREEVDCSSLASPPLAPVAAFQGMLDLQL